MKVTKITNCRLCDCSELRPVFSLQPTPVGDYYLSRAQHPERLECYPLNVFLCPNCGHAQLDALVDPGEIYSHYLYTTSVSLGLADHFLSYADTVCAKLRLAPGSLVVDIGSNDGTLLRAFQQKGMRVLGVDPAKAIAERATAAGIPTLNAFFDTGLAENIRREHGGADLVIANNVIANVPNPLDFVQGVSLLLAEQGHFVWETGYVRYLTEGCVFDNIHHEHIDYYAVRPLIEFYRRLGLALFDVEVSNSKGSSIRCYVSRVSAQQAVAPSVQALVAHEEKQGYFTPVVPAVAADPPPSPPAPPAPTPPTVKAGPNDD
jgi:SAM-dependent methyltransferase